MVGRRRSSRRCGAPRARAGGDTGASMVEFAVVVGPLLALILGSVAFGVLLATRHSLDEAAGEAARAAAVSWDDPGTAVDERVEVAMDALESSSTVGNRCASPATSGLTCTVSVSSCSGDPSLSCLTVALVHDRSVDPIVGRLPLIEAVLPSRLTARATVVLSDG